MDGPATTPRVKTVRARVYSAGQVARALGVAARTVAKWVDSGKLRGFRIPGSQDRRVLERDMVAFAYEHGMMHLMDAVVRPMLYAGNSLDFPDADVATSWSSAGWLLARRYYHNVVFDCRMGRAEVARLLHLVGETGYRPRTVVIVNEEDAVSQYVVDLNAAYPWVVRVQAPLDERAVLKACVSESVLPDRDIRLTL